MTSGAPRAGDRGTQDISAHRDRELAHSGRLAPPTWVLPVVHMNMRGDDAVQAKALGLRSWLGDRTGARCIVLDDELDGRTAGLILPSNARVIAVDPVLGVTGEIIAHVEELLLTPDWPSAAP